MSKHLKILAIDACGCGLYWGVHSDRTPKTFECGHCGYVCRVIELNLGLDPATLLERAAGRANGEAAFLRHACDDEAPLAVADDYEADALVLGKAAEVLKAGATETPGKGGTG